jgi:hypothetical protein
MTQKPDRQHLLGFSFIVIAAIMVIQGIWLGAQQSSDNECQAQYNAAFRDVAQQRAQWADEDNRDLHKMAQTLIDPKVSQAEKSQAFQHWVEQTNKNDQNRQANPLPSRTSCG